MRSDRDELLSLRSRRPSRPKRVAQLVSEMLQCLQSGAPINLGVPPHADTTEALRKLVFRDPPTAGSSNILKVRFTGEQPILEFPVYRLWAPPNGWPFEPEPARHLHLGTLCLRHVDYDRHVDMYLIRDKETRGLNQSAIEDLAYRNMKEVLDSEPLSDEFWLSIFQAGLEPLAVGMYRALVQHLEKRRDEGRPTLHVRPIFGERDDGTPDDGAIWAAGA